MPKAYPFIVFDTEDDSAELMAAGRSGFDKQVTQVAAITGEGEHYYNRGDVAAFRKWLGRKPQKNIYANNIQYDLGNVFGDDLDDLDTTLVGGRVIKSQWGSKLFLDVFNLWFCSVKALGDAFNLPKLETHSMATDRDYVFRDCEIIWLAVNFAYQFAELLGLKHLPTTAGGVCFAAWQKMGGYNCHDSLEISREAYFGGRVELWKVFNEFPFVYYTDLNSLYPHVLGYEYPGVLEDCGRELKPWGIATVDIKVPETDCPILPYRGIDGRVFYPVGRFTGTWTMAEIREAVAAGAQILRVRKSYGTDTAMRPYKEVMDTFYQARLTARNAAEREFFKRMMNAFYGRLGTSGKIGRTVHLTEENRHKGVPFGERCLVEYNMPLDETTNWSHAAYVTAYGRLELLKYIRKIRPENLIYTDTDCAIADCPWPIFNLQFSQEPRPGAVTCNRLSIPYETGKELGQMKLEGWESLVRVWAPKLYRTGRHWKAKGVPRRLAREFIETGEAHFDLPFKFREAVAFFDPVDRKGNPRAFPNSKKLSVWRRVVKKMVSGYDKKRLVGNRFFPCKINRIAP